MILRNLTPNELTLVENYVETLEWCKMILEGNYPESSLLSKLYGIEEDINYIIRKNYVMEVRAVSNVLTTSHNLTNFLEKYIKKYLSVRGLGRRKKNGIISLQRLEELSSIVTELNEEAFEYLLYVFIKEQQNPYNPDSFMEKFEFNHLDLNPKHYNSPHVLSVYRQFREEYLKRYCKCPKSEKKKKVKSLEEILAPIKEDGKILEEKIAIELYKKKKRIIELINLVTSYLKN